MKDLFRLGQIILSVLFLIISHSCQKEGDDIKIKKDKLSGYVQKGPFINGTSIQMFELKSTLNQTGKVFSTQITDNKGSFEITDIELSSQFIEFYADGYYFDENTGDISPSQLSLYALSDITDISTVNVNILTHLEKSRVAYLVGQGEDFSEAKDTAQKEILAIFGLSLNEMVNSETLDISLNTEENAILLAISIILQGNRSVGDLTELLATITNDIREDGILNSESIMLSLRNSTKDLVLPTIRSNLETRYQSLGISASIPGFEKYINDFLVFTSQKPVATTLAGTNITTTGVMLNAVVDANSLSTTVTFEYGTSTSYGSIATASQSPVTGNTIISVSSNITGLLPGIIYHFRVKAVNELGEIVGDDITFKTCTIADIDGNGYNTVTIGTQVWMTENLKTIKYNDGTSIPLVTDYTSWQQVLSAPAYCWYNNDELTFKDAYGALYNWYAVDDSSNGGKNVCPIGWHVPTDEEWTTLTTYLGGESVAGGKLKETGTIHWLFPNTGATNETGFTALPSGYRYPNGLFSIVGTYGGWWSSSKDSTSFAYYRLIYSDFRSVHRVNTDKQFGFSVRCLQDL